MSTSYRIKWYIFELNQIIPTVYRQSLISSCWATAVFCQVGYFKIKIFLLLEFRLQANVFNGLGIPSVVEPSLSGFRFIPRVTRFSSFKQSVTVSTSVHLAKTFRETNDGRRRSLSTNRNPFDHSKCRINFNAEWNATDFGSPTINREHKAFQDISKFLNGLKVFAVSNKTRERERKVM